MSLPTYEDTPTWNMGAVLRPFWLLLSPPPPVCFALQNYCTGSDRQTLATAHTPPFPSLPSLPPTMAIAHFHGHRSMGHGCRPTPREALTNSLTPAPSLPLPPPRPSPPVCFALPHYVPARTDELRTLSKLSSHDKKMACEWGVLSLVHFNSVCYI